MRKCTVLFVLLVFAICVFKVIDTDFKDSFDNATTNELTATSENKVLLKK